MDGQASPVSGRPDRSHQGARTRWPTWMVGALLAVLFVLLVGMAFGSGQSCTDDYSCTTTTCDPACDRIDQSFNVAAVVLLGLLVALWLGRRRPGVPLFVGVSGVAIVVVAGAVMSSYPAP